MGQDFIEEHVREFRALTMEQLVSTDLTTHNFRYYELYLLFRKAVNNALIGFCQKKNIGTSSFESLVEALAGVSAYKTGTEDDGSAMSNADLELGRLLRAFLDSTEYESFVSLMLLHVAEQEEGDNDGAESEVEV